MNVSIQYSAELFIEFVNVKARVKYDICFINNLTLR